MPEIHAFIVRWVDNSQPGIVECNFTDVSGRTWSFIEKLPVVSLDDLNENSEYPQPCQLACEFIEEKVDDQGRKIFVVDTDKPWGIESGEGITRFEVFEEQVEVT